MTTRQVPPTWSTERFIFPSSSAKTRSFLTFSASFAATASSSSGPTPRSTKKPRPTLPTTSPATRTWARDTRCTSALTSEERRLLGRVDDDAALARRQRVQGALDLLHVLPHEPLGAAPLARRVAQQVGRVEERHDPDAVPSEPPTAQPGDALGGLEEVLGRHVTQRAYHLRLDDPDLLEQHALAGGDLGRRGVAVARRAVLHDVGDVDLVALEPHRREDLVEELAGAAHERPTGEVLLLAGRLAHEHEPGVLGTLPEDQVVRQVLERRRLLGRQPFQFCERHAYVDNTGARASALVRVRRLRRGLRGVQRLALAADLAPQLRLEADHQAEVLEGVLAALDLGVLHVVAAGDERQLAVGPQGLFHDLRGRHGLR